MDKSERELRAQDRIINRLCQAGFEGAPPSELAKLADSNNYRRGRDVLAGMLSDGDVERVGSRYRLTLQIVDEIAHRHRQPSRVETFLNLASPQARELRRQRIAAYGADVMANGQTPPYFYGGFGPGFGRWSADEVASICARLDGESFWSTPEPDPTPEPTIATIAIPEQPFTWEPQVQPTVEPAGFWA
jgi:hypothetical protein